MSTNEMENDNKMLLGGFDNEVNQMEITPYMAIMRIVKIVYGQNKPEVYKMLIALIHDYNPYSGRAHYEKTIKYVNILLDSKPELADYLIGIIPKPEDVSKAAVPSNSPVVPIQSAGELLRQSLHILGIKGKGFDLKLPEDHYKKFSREKQTNNEGKTKIYKFYNFTPPTTKVHNEKQANVNNQTVPPNQVKQKWTTHGLKGDREEQEPIANVKSEPIDTDEFVDVENLQELPVKAEPIRGGGSHLEHATEMTVINGRPVIIRKPDLKSLKTQTRLPIPKSKPSSNQSFPYTQQVIFSDGTKQNLIFNTKSKEDVRKTSTAVRLPKPTTAAAKGDDIDPLSCLQQMVSKTKMTALTEKVKSKPITTQNNLSGSTADVNSSGDAITLVGDNARPSTHKMKSQDQSSQCHKIDPPQKISESQLKNEDTCNNELKDLNINVDIITSGMPLHDVHSAPIAVSQTTEPVTSENPRNTHTKKRKYAKIS